MEYIWSLNSEKEKDKTTNNSGNVSKEAASSADSNVVDIVNNRIYKCNIYLILN